MESNGSQGQESKKQSLQGTWKQALWEFSFPLFLVLVLRWALIEPFVIPSGSMIPSLLVHDHILVNKLGLGLKVPFVNHWIVRWGQLQRGDIVVFKYPKEPDTHFVKRLIGLPGDVIEINQGRVVSINNEPVVLSEIQDLESEIKISEAQFSAEPGYTYYKEDLGGRSHWMRLQGNERGSGESEKIAVPIGSYFFMGDNRDESSDSRAWGFVQENLLVGKAALIWLSCENTLPTSSFICDPSQLRMGRIGKWVQL